jgi:TonB family protein
MQPIIMRNVRAICFTLLVVLSAAASSAPKSRRREPDALPKKPAAIIAAAARLNGLTGTGLQPWHIRAAYQAFDKSGKLQESGTYEEWWISDGEYKQSYSSHSFNQTEFAAGAGVYQTGDQGLPGYVETTVRNDLIEPIPANLDLSGLLLGKNRRTAGKVKLECVNLESPPSKMIAMKDSGYCFDFDQPVLRVVSSWNRSQETAFNDIAVFQGRLVAREISVVEKRHVTLAIHVQDLSLLARSAANIVPPAASARVVQGAIEIPEKTLRALYVRQVAPDYPENAKASHIQGSVVIEIAVGTDGRVTSARAVSGPDELRAAGLGCTHGWEFRPLLVAGQPHPFESSVHLIFTLGG